MGYIIGVDLGTSGTKLAARGPRGVAFQRRPTVRGEALAARAVEQFLDWAEVPRNEVDRLVLTGVRTSFFTRPLLGLPTFTVPEFEAIGRGGMIAGVERVLVVSMGTGTALVMAGPAAPSAAWAGCCWGRAGRTGSASWPSGAGRRGWTCSWGTSAGWTCPTSSGT